MTEPAAENPPKHPQPATSPSPASVDAADLHREIGFCLPPLRTPPRTLLAITAAIGLVLFIWLLLFPYSGDGDASLHLRNLRQGWVDLSYILHAWARPLYALVMMPAAYFGNLPVRIFTLLLSLVLVWQTIRLAEDVGLKRAVWAGPLMIFQPFAFALASDTMTEMPMALVMVLAVRAYLHRRYEWSALLIGLSPLVRPEGFFFGLLWGLLLISHLPGPLSIRRRLTCLGLMSLGLVGWVALCWMITGDPMYFRTAWSWTTDYGDGPWYHYLRSLPVILGLPIFILWVAGLVLSFRNPRMALPWAVFLIVFVTHSVLWAGGWQASAGLLRIIACVAPFAALVAVHGLELVERRLDRVRTETWTKPAITAAFVFSTVFVAGWTYFVQPANHEPRLFAALLPELRQAVDRAEPGTPLVLSDTTARNMLELPPIDDGVVQNSFDRSEQLKLLADLPVGTVGLWDNQRGRVWHKVTIGDLQALGFEVIASHEISVYAWWGGFQDMQAGVVRKTRVVPVPDGLVDGPGH